MNQKKINSLLILPYGLIKAFHLFDTHIFLYSHTNRYNTFPFTNEITIIFLSCDLVLTWVILNYLHTQHVNSIRP